MIQPKEDVIHLPISAIFISLFVLNGVFTITGNTLICFAFYRNRRLRTVTNIYVLSLAIADITTATFTVPFSSISTGFGKWPFNFNFCQFQGFVCYIYAQISVNILALTAVNRYFCIVKPHLYPVFCTRKKTIVLIIFVAVLTFSAFLTATLVTPVLFEWNPFYLFCSPSGHEVNKNFSIFITGLLAFTIFPILLCYGAVYRAIRRHNSTVNPSLQQAGSRGTVSPHEIHASRILLAAVMGFCICWIPPAVVRVLQDMAHLSVPPFWLSFSTLSAASSGWINPVVYGVMNRAMRKEFVKLLRCQSRN